MTLPDFETVELGSGNRAMRLRDTRPQPPTPMPKAGTVQWYIPYTYVHPMTVAGAPPDAIWVDLTGSNFAYFGALLDWWGRGESFAVLEHDVVCRPDVIEAFETCPEPWCMYGYSTICHPECMEAWRNALGCTRFSAELMAAVPDAVSSIPEDNWDWHNVCDGLGNHLREAGFTHHWHEPWVNHHSWAAK